MDTLAEQVLRQLEPLSLQEQVVRAGALIDEARVMQEALARMRREVVAALRAQYMDEGMNVTEAEGRISEVTGLTLPTIQRLFATRPRDPS